LRCNFDEQSGSVNHSLQQGKGRSSGQLHIRRASHLVQLVMQQTGMPQADAEKRVDAAEHARKATLIAAFLAAATLAIGCAAACGAASLGGRHRDENTLVVFWGSRRFW
jgi:predicted homoserine dehydrogenase-like protein